MLPTKEENERMGKLLLHGLAYDEPEHELIINCAPTKRGEGVILGYALFKGLFDKIGAEQELLKDSIKCTHPGDNDHRIFAQDLIRVIYNLQVNEIRIAVDKYFDDGKPTYRGMVELNLKRAIENRNLYVIENVVFYLLRLGRYTIPLCEQQEKHYDTSKVWTLQPFQAGSSKLPVSV